jgi:hypothetical protein
MSNYDNLLDEKNGVEEIFLEKKVFNMKATIQTSDAPVLPAIDKRAESKIVFYEKITGNLSPEDYRYAKSLLINKGCYNCQNGSCRVEADGKVGVDGNGLPMGNSCIGWENPELIGRIRVLKK